MVVRTLTHVFKYKVDVFVILCSHDIQKLHNVLVVTKFLD